MSDLVINQNCWYSHAQAHFALDDYDVSHMTNLKNSLFIPGKSSSDA